MQLLLLPVCPWACCLHAFIHALCREELPGWGCDLHPLVERVGWWTEIYELIIFPWLCWLKSSGKPVFSTSSTNNLTLYSSALIERVKMQSIEAIIITLMKAIIIIPAADVQGVTCAKSHLLLEFSARTPSLPVGLSGGDQPCHVDSETSCTSPTAVPTTHCDLRF